MNQPKALKIGKNKEIGCSIARLERKKNAAYKVIHDKNIESLLPFNSNSCCYCAKVFLNTKFMINHALRRHSDQLKTKNNPTEISYDGKNLTNKTLMQFIVYNFAKFQTELETIKLLISNQRVLYNVSQNIHPNLSNNKFEKSINAQTVYVPEEMKDLKSRLFKLEDNFKLLEETFNSLRKISKEKIWDETEMCNQLRESLLCEFQPTAFENSENNLSYITYFSNIKAEIEELKCLIKENSKNIDSVYKSVFSEVRNELENELSKKLENEIFVFLTNIKEDKSKLCQKEALQILQNSCNVLQEGHKSKRTKNKLFNTPKQSQLQRVMNLKLTNFESCLEEKLKVLNISVAMERLSISDYDTKQRLVQAEKEILSKKFKNFLKIRNYIDSYSEKLVLLRLKNKTCKKLEYTNASKKTTENKLHANNSSLDDCCAVCFITEKKKIPNSSASQKLFDYQNKHNVPEAFYNLAEELCPISVFESKHKS